MNQFFSIAGGIKFSEFINNEELINKYYTENVLQTVKKKNLESLFGADFDPKNNAQYDINTIKKLGTGKIFLHFDFDGIHWYEFESELDLIIEKMLDDFYEQSEALI